MSLNLWFYCLNNKFVYSKYSTATGRDLWNAFQKAIEEAGETYAFPKDLDAATVMESWEKQAGIPVLNVTRNYSAQYIEFSQVLIT